MNLFETISTPIYSFCDNLIANEDGGLITKLRDILAVLVFNALFFGLLLAVPAAAYYFKYMA